MANDHLVPRDLPFVVGDLAPDFTLLDQDRAEWRLSDHVKQGDVVLSFYPMSFTGVCGTEMKCISDELSRPATAGTTIVGISCDSFPVQKAWADQMGFKQRLLADMHRAVCRAYGLYWPDLNVAWRGTVIVGKSPDGKGRVKWVQKREIKQAFSLDELLAALA